jgi:hypothetical protein
MDDVTFFRRLAWLRVNALNDIEALLTYDWSAERMTEEINRIITEYKTAQTTLRTQPQSPV